MKGKQQGQAISEFLVSLILFVVMILGLFVIGNMVSIQTTAHKAARYMAWERIAYNESDYNAQLTSQADGIASDITSRFLENNGVGFGGSSSGANREWTGVWGDENVRAYGREQLRMDENRSLVDLSSGVSVLDPDEFDTARNSITQFASQNSTQINWANSRTDLELDTSDSGFIAIPLSRENNFLLSGLPEGDYQLKGSFALISDGWESGSEQQFSDRVDALRNRSAATAHRVQQRTATAGLVRGTFKELNEKLYVSDSPFDMVSENQSTSLPSNLPAYDEDSDALDVTNPM